MKFAYNNTTIQFIPAELFNEKKKKNTNETLNVRVCARIFLTEWKQHTARALFQFGVVLNIVAGL